MKKSLSIILLILIFCSEAYSQAIIKLDASLNYKSSVMDFTPGGLPLIRDGKEYQATPADLEEGSVFIDVDSIAKRVISIKESGRSVVIYTVRADFNEFIESFEITDWDIIMEPGIHDLSSGSRGTFEYSSTLYQSSHGKLTASGRVSINELSVTGSSRGAGWTDGYISAKLNYDIDTDLNLHGEYSRSLKIPRYPVPNFSISESIGPISVFGGLYFYIDMNSKFVMNIDIDTHLEGSLSARCSLSGVSYLAYPHAFHFSSNNFKYFIKINPMLSGHFDSVVALYNGAMLKIGGYELVNIRAGVGVTADINGSVTTDADAPCLGYGNDQGYDRDWSDLDFNSDGLISFYSKAKVTLLDDANTIFYYNTRIISW